MVCIWLKLPSMPPPVEACVQDAACAGAGAMTMASRKVDASRMEKTTAASLRFIFTPPLIPEPDSHLSIQHLASEHNFYHYPRYDLPLDIISAITLDITFP